MRQNSVEVSQSVANKILALFGTRKFQEALIILVNKQAGLLGLLGLIVLIKPNELSAQ
jgi:hypothetical protein